MDPGDFSGAHFSLETVQPLGLATVRVRFTQDPRRIGDDNIADALTIGNYTLVGPNLNYIVGAVEVLADPQAIDLYLAGPLEIGTYTLSVANIESDEAQPLEAPASLSFPVTKLVQQEGVPKGAVNDAVENIVRKFLNPGLKGSGWDAMVAALAAGDANAADTAKLAFDQLYRSSASGKYLDRRAGDIGLRRPTGVAMSDELFRELAAIVATNKLTQDAILEILEVFYGPDAMRANITSVEEVYALEDGDDLLISIDERTPVSIVFRRGEFARIGRALAIEVAASITRQLHAVGSNAYAIAVTNEISGLGQVRIYSGSLGLPSSLRIVGGSAQIKLQFPTTIFEQTGSSPYANWTITLSSTDPGKVRFTENSGYYNLNDLVVGDRVYIYGHEFDSGNVGSFEITNVQVYYSGMTLVRYFEIENPTGFAQTVSQLTWQSLMFFRPSRHTIYNNARHSIVSETDDSVEIVIPATTQAVSRHKTTAAYLADSSTLTLLTSITRYPGGDVLAVTGGTHGLEVGDWVKIDRASPKLDETSGRSSFWDHTTDVQRAYHKAIRLDEGGVLIVGGIDTTSLVSATPVTALELFEVTADTAPSIPAWTRAVTHTWSTLTDVTTMGSQNFGLARVYDSVYMFGGHNGYVPQSSNVFNSLLFRRDPATDVFTTGTTPFNAAAHAACGDGNGDLISCGGFDFWNVPVAASYKLSAGDWTTLADMNMPRLEHQLVQITSGDLAGKVLAIGGRRPVSRDFDTADTNYWSFDDGTGTDSIGGLTVNLTAGTTSDVGKAGFGFRATGAASFSGPGAEQNALDSLLESNHWTIECWTTKANGTVLCIGGDGTTSSKYVRFGILISAGFLVGFYQRNDGVVLQATFGALPSKPADSVSSPTYTHIAITYDTGVLKGYADGVLINSFNSITLNNTATAAGTYFGDDSRGTFPRFAGSVDEIRISNVTRSAVDILTHYRAQRGVVLFDSPTQPIGRCIEMCEYFDGSAWQRTGSMAWARFGFSAVTLPDGRIVVLGGYGHRPNDHEAQALSSCEIWDPNTKLWSSLPSMSIARVYPVAGYSAAHNAIIVSGSGDDSVEYLDIATMTWRKGLVSASTMGARAAGGIAGSDILVCAGGIFDSPQASTSVFVPGLETIVQGGLNSFVRVETTPSSTEFTFKTPGYNEYTDIDLTDDLTVITKVGAITSYIPGPFALDKESVSITDITGVLVDGLDAGRQYESIDLQGVDSALNFPDQAGWLVFNFGGSDQVGPVPYLGRLSETELAIDYRFRFNHNVPAGSTVHLLAGKSAYVPSGLVGQAYLTGSSAGRVAAEKIIDDSLAVGIEATVIVEYPGDRGLGGEGKPTSGSNKLSDIVAVFAGDNVDGDVAKAKG